MPLALVGRTTAGATGASVSVPLTALSGGSRAAPADKDVVFVIVGAAGTSAVAPTVTGNNSGLYVEAFAPLYANDTWDTNFAVFYGVQGTTPDTSITVTSGASAGYPAGIQVHVWSGALLDRPFALNHVTATGTNGAALNPPNAPNLSAGCVVGAGAGTMPATEATGYTGIPGSGMSVVPLLVNGSTCSISVFSATWPNSGQSGFDPGAVTGGTQTNNSSSWAGVTFLINERPMAYHNLVINSGGALRYKSPTVVVSQSAPTQDYTAQILAGSPMGVASSLATSMASWASASSPLAPAVVRAVMGGRAICAAPAVLGESRAIAENPVVLVQGSSLTQYGTHSAAAVVVAEGASATQYGGVLASYDVSVSVDATLPSTRAGVPLAWHIESQAVTTVHDAYGSCLTGYGSPSAGHPQLGNVQGAALTGYGAIQTAVMAQPSSACTTASGIPSVAGIVSISGARATKYGTPSNVIAHIVSGVCRTRYGKAKVRFPDAHMVYGLNNGRRAGVPRAVELA